MVPTGKNFLYILFYWSARPTVVIRSLMCIWMRAVSLRCVRLLACQAPLSVGFSRQENWSGFPCPPPGDLPDPGMEPASLMSPALAGGSLPLALPGKPGVPLRNLSDPGASFLEGSRGMNAGLWWPEVVLLTAVLGRKTKAAGSCHWQFFSVSFWRLLNEKTHVLQCGINFKTMVNNFFCSDSVQLNLSCIGFTGFILKVGSLPFLLLLHS